MPNDRLRDILLGKGLTPEDVADALGRGSENGRALDHHGPDPVSAPPARDRRDGRRERDVSVARGAASQRRAEVARSEIVQVYPHRNSVPADLWDALLEKATTYIDILVYVGMFMTEKPDLIKAMREKGENGARVRLLFGDRDAPAVTQRSIDEGIGEHTIAAKIDHALAFFSALAGAPGIEIRTHEDRAVQQHLPVRR